MTGAGSGGGGGYDYVEAFYPSDAEEGESLYHLTENAAFVYSGTEWIEQTVTDHSQLSGVNEGDHRSDSRVSALAPLQSVNGRTGDVSGLFEASDYTPEADTHTRYTDAEAESAAPVQSVEGGTGAVELYAKVADRSGNSGTNSNVAAGGSYTLSQNFAASDEEKTVTVDEDMGYNVTVEIDEGGGYQTVLSDGQVSNTEFDISSDATAVDCRVTNNQSTFGTTVSITFEYAEANEIKVKP